MGIPERKGSDAATGDTVAFGVIPQGLLDRPLDFFHSEHFRQRRFCAALRAFAEETVLDRKLARELLNFLETDWSRHRQEEQELLFPALRRRSKAEDEIAPVLDRLQADDVNTQRRQRRIRTILREALADGEALQSRDCALIKAYVEANLRQLAIENGVVLAIARRRLSERDLGEISYAMKVRRGVRYHVPDA